MKSIFAHIYTAHASYAIMAAVLWLLLLLLNLNVNEDEEDDDDCTQSLIRLILLTKEENWIPFANAPYEYVCSAFVRGTS